MASFVGASSVMATVIAALVAVPSASAASFTVDKQKDGVDATPADGVCATDEGDCTLRAAIGEANSAFGDDVIDVPAGTYRLKLPTGGATLPNNGGDLNLHDVMTINGAGRSETVIEQTVKDRVLTNSAGGGFNPVELNDLTIMGGRESGPLRALGGGIYNEFGFLLLQGVAVRDNLAKPGNRSQAAFGGGIYQEGGILGLLSSTVRDNAARAQREFSEGGGIYTAAGSLAINASQVQRNVVRVAQRPRQGFTGGVLASGPTTVSDSTIAGNSSLGGAGGLSTLGTLEMQGSTVSGNSGRDAGGVYNEETASIFNSTISGNSVSDRQGAAFYFGGDAATLTHVTIADNKAGGDRSPVFVTSAPAGSVDLVASIVANPGNGDECGGKLEAIEAEARNVIADSSCSDPPVTNDDIANPKLRSLDANGGPTRTHALRASSPAIGLVPSCSTSVDQRFAPRALGMPCASGAFEPGP